MNYNEDDLINEAVKTNNLDEKKIAFLLSPVSSAQKLFSAADIVRKENVGDGVHLRALIEFSNYCSKNCSYCGLRKDNKKLNRYRIEPYNIVELARKAKNYGYKTIVLQSGEDPYYSTEKMVYIISSIKKSNIALTLSIGEKTFEEYKAFREAGADRYLLRIETTDEELYKKLNPQRSLKNRMHCIEDIKKLGYEAGSGIIVGLPGQTIESIAKDILYLKTISVDMAGIGPFIHNPNTPIDKNEGDFFTLSLKVMSILRLQMPSINIPATTAMETLNPNGRLIALQSGANVVMPNATETIYRKFYEIYPGKICLNDSPVHCRFCIENKINSIGRTVARSKGFHIKNTVAEDSVA